MKKLLELYTAFFKIGALTFGGGYAMLPMIEREVVEKKKWATLEEVMDYFAIGQCTPGVIAVNTATFIGHKIKGISGGIVATLGVITPSFIIISAVASVLKLVYQNPVAQHAFAGIGVAVCALLLQAFLKLAKTGVKNKFGIAVAFIAFLCSFIFEISTILLILLAGVCGVVYGKIKAKNKE